jgi:multiple sugar transport system permease protein
MTLRRAIFITGIVLLCAWILMPIYVIALAAVGGPTVVNSWPKPFLPPAEMSFTTIREFFDIAGVWSSALYSVEAAVLCMAFSLLLGVPAGYALARFVFPGATTYRLLILLTGAFPVAILALPLTVGFIRFGLYDTPLGVSLMHTTLALPFAVLISASLFQAIPRELEEAAWVFGCSPVRAFLRVVLPLALPGIAAVAIFAFVISWNEVFAASVLTVRHKTLTAYLLSVLSESPLHVQFAGGFVLIIPSVLFIFLVRKRLFSMWGIANR